VGEAGRPGRRRGAAAARASLCPSLSFSRHRQPSSLLAQVTFTYSPGQARPDHTFMHYGFLNRVRRERPHLACIDLANRTLWDCPGPDAAELGLEGAQCGGGPGRGVEGCGRAEHGQSGGVEQGVEPPPFSSHVDTANAHHHRRTHPRTPPHPSETPINTTEAERLDLILRSFPTTEVDDYAALKGKPRACGA